MRDYFYCLACTSSNGSGFNCIVRMFILTNAHRCDKQAQGQYSGEVAGWQGFAGTVEDVDVKNLTWLLRIPCKNLPSDEAGV